MTTEAFIQRFHDLACAPADAALDADSLIGFFQVFRPDGAAIANLYDDLDVGEAMLYAAPPFCNGSGEGLTVWD